jgi:hypothetical protein
MCCTGERSAIATDDCVGKGSSHWCREFELARVISFDSVGSIGTAYQDQKQELRFPACFAAFVFALFALGGAQR